VADATKLDYETAAGHSYSITVQASDGTATSSNSFNIAVTDVAALITGASTGSVTEAGGVANGTPGTPTATGDLNVTDIHSTSDVWQVVSSGTASTGGYGTYAVDATGHWTYTLNNANASVQALNVGATLTDTFTVNSAYSASQVVTVTITGANDA